MSYTSDNLKEIRDLKTNNILGKERYSLLHAQFETVQKDFKRIKVHCSELDRNLGLMTDKADALENKSNHLEKILNVTAAAKLSSDQIAKASEEQNVQLSEKLKITQENLDTSQKEAATLDKKVLECNQIMAESKRMEVQLQTKYQAKCCEIISLEGALDEQARQVGVLMQHVNKAGGGVPGPGTGMINFDMKKKKERNAIGRSNTVGMIPHVGLSHDEDDADSTSSKRSKLLENFTNEVNSQHLMELNKKDHKIRKLEDKLRKSQTLLKNALDRVWQLEKVKLDEASGAIPIRKGTTSRLETRERDNLTHLSDTEEGDAFST